MVLNDEDRELLVRHDVKLCEIREDLKEFKNDWKVHRVEILATIKDGFESQKVHCFERKADVENHFDKVEHIQKTKLKGSVFWSIITAIVLPLLLGAYVYTARVDAKSETRHYQQEQKIDRHIESTIEQMKKAATR
jgi:hypothetical protein